MTVAKKIRIKRTKKFWIFSTFTSLLVFRVHIGFISSPYKFSSIWGWIGPYQLWEGAVPHSADH